MSKRRHTTFLATAFVATALAAPTIANGPHSSGYVSAPLAQPYAQMGYAQPGGGDFSVDLNHTGVLRLPIAASAVVVGNPDVADVAVHSTDTLLVLGRSYGTTNVLAMDASGRVIGDYRVIVGSHSRNARVRIYQGTERQTFDCATNCNPAPELGDSEDFYGSYRPAAQPISNTTASPGSSVHSGMPPSSQFDMPSTTFDEGAGYGYAPGR